MRMDSFFGSNRMLCSTDAEDGAKRLIEKIEDGALQMDVLPNRYDKFSGELEERDYVSFCRFLESSNGEKVLNMLEVDDAGSFIEL